MASFSMLGTSGVQAIVAYLRSFEKFPNRSAEVDMEPDAFGDPRFGKQWYEQICSTCHGIAGEGYETGGSGTAIAKSGFLSQASDGFIRETIKKGRSNTPMHGFKGPNAGLADLSDHEIGDIIVYLRSVQTVPTVSPCLLSRTSSLTGRLCSQRCSSTLLLHTGLDLLLCLEPVTEFIAGGKATLFRNEIGGLGDHQPSFCIVLRRC